MIVQDMGDDSGTLGEYKRHEVEPKQVGWNEGSLESDHETKITDYRRQIGEMKYI